MVRKRARQQGVSAAGTTHSNIVQPFVWAPQFYGCVVCGRYHICRRDERECEVVQCETELTCLHSRQVLRQVYALASFDDEQQFDREHCDGDAEPRLASGRTRRVFRAATGLYSNSRMQQPLCELEALEALEKREARDEERRETQRQRDKQSRVYCQAGGGDDEAEEGVVVEMMQVEQSNEARLKNWHDNRAYWNEYFGFLLETPAPPPSNNNSNDGTHERSAPPALVVFPDPASLMRPLELQARQFGLGTETGALVDDTVYEIVGRLMKAQHRALGRKQPPQTDALNRQIVAALLRPIQQIVALCLHASPQMGVRNACIALLLIGLAESHYDTDSYRQRIEVWHRQPWLAHLRESGVTETLFAPPRRRNHRPVESVKKKLRYDQTQIKAAWGQVERALAHYSGHGLWLRSIVLK